MFCLIAQLDISQLVLEAMLRLWPWLALAAIFFIGYSFFKAKIKGHIGEKVVQRALKKLPKNYHQWHDVYLLDGNGHTTQIDHLIASPYGIFVIETKNMKGWIWGGERKKLWTQQIFRHKSQFQNPLHQNSRHINVLAEVTGLPRSEFKSIIFFVGEATLKGKFPANVMTSNLCKYILSYQEKMSIAITLDEFVALINRHNKSSEKGIAKRHVRSLKERKLGRQSEKI